MTTINVTKTTSSQIAIILFLAALLAGCPSNEGPKVAADPDTFFPDAIPEGEPVFVQVDKAFYGNLTVPVQGGGTGTAFSLASLDTSHAAPYYDVILFDVDSDFILELNIVDDDTLDSEVSIIAKDDSVFKVVHDTGELKNLKHFSETVCELIPAERVETDYATGKHTVLHEEWVYVKTASAVGVDSGEDVCTSTETAKRYYQLALNYQFDADEDDPDTTNVLPTVSESKARAQLVFGWADRDDLQFGWAEDEIMDPDADKYLGYGYLGVGFAEQKVKFFDASRNQVWSQDRTLEQFTQVRLAKGDLSERYLVHFEQLNKTHYLLQLGRDVFVFDASEELFARNFSVADEALEDRVFRLEQNIYQEKEIIEQLVAIADEEEVLFVDQFKVYRYDYISHYSAPSSPIDFEVKSQNVISIDKVTYGDDVPFSQFDLKACDRFDDEAACNDANTPDPILNAEWQFITNCTSEFDCEFESVSDGVCATDEELIIDPNAGTRCTASNYAHLNDLNTSANDAEFRGYLQYGAEYIRSLSMQLHTDSVGGKSLYMTPRFNTRELLLQYFYDQDISAPKADRERILLGERGIHQGIDAYLADFNLYATTLFYKSTRSNECYKNYQLVECDLGQIETNGGITTCTGVDLAEGLCFDTYMEYESLALFCSEEDINNGQCNDNHLLASREIAVEGADQDARWMPIFTPSSSTPDIYLLTTSDTLVSRYRRGDDISGLVEGVFDEGVLQLPTLNAVSYTLGSIETTPLISLPVQVEHVLTNSYIDGNTFGRFNIVSEDARQQGGATLANVDSTVDTVFFANGWVQNASERFIERPLTGWDE